MTKRQVSPARNLPALFSVCALLASTPAASGGEAPKSAVSVETPGTSLTDAFRQALAKRLAASALPVTFSPWDGRLATIQQREAANASEPDLVLMPSEVALVACREGLLLPIAPSNCVVPGFETALVLAWDRTRDPTPPSWADFWDVARYPGKRGLPRQARGTLEIALMADGVAPGDVYRVLASGDGVERAFRKLDQLRPYVVWWTDGGAASKALTSGGVLMTAAPATDLPSTGKPEAAVGQQWTGALSERLSWGVPLRAPDEAGARRFLDLEQQPGWQSAVTAAVPVVGAAPGALDATPADLLARTQAAPHRGERMLRIDDVFWNDHHELVGRFEAWLAVGP